jgi:hypothetical protein
MTSFKLTRPNLVHTVYNKVTACENMALKHLAKDREHWQAFMNTVIKLRVPKKQVLF